MKKLLFAGLLITLFISGCSTPTPLPTATTEPEATTIPELVLEIRNESDPLRTPYGIALDSTGNIYVNDAGNSRVLVFDEDGTLLAKWDRQEVARENSIPSGLEVSQSTFMCSSWITATTASRNLIPPESF